MPLPRPTPPRPRAWARVPVQADPTSDPTEGTRHPTSDPTEGHHAHYLSLARVITGDRQVNHARHRRGACQAHAHYLSLANQSQDIDKLIMLDTDVVLVKPMLII